MSVSAAGTVAPAGATSTAVPPRPGAQRDAAATPAQTQTDFERVMRAKQSRRDGGDEGEDASDHDDKKEGVPAAVPGTVPALAAPALRPAEATPAPSAPRTLDAPPTGTRAAIETALNTNVAPAFAALGEIDPAALWEASVREPNSVAVDVRALRAERSGQEAGAAWTVSVRSSSVNAETLARHAPRLDERLRKRAAGFTHVRIEADDAGQE